MILYNTLLVSITTVTSESMTVLNPTFKTSLVPLHTHSSIFTQTKKYITICDSIHSFYLSLCRKLHTTHTTRILSHSSEIFHHKHPATAFVPGKKATSIRCNASWYVTVKTKTRHTCIATSAVQSFKEGPHAIRQNILPLHASDHLR